MRFRKQPPTHLSHPFAAAFPAISPATLWTPLVAPAHPSPHLSKNDPKAIMEAAISSALCHPNVVQTVSLHQAAALSPCLTV
jgi:hypothetical protein